MQLRQNGWGGTFVNRVGYGEVDESGEFLIVDHDWMDGTVSSVLGRYRLNDFGPQIISQIRLGHSVKIDDVQLDLRTAGTSAARALADIEVQATVAVPFMEAGRFVAMLYAHQAKPRLWLDEELVLMEEIVERTRHAVGRVRAEAALRESEARFRQFADHSTSLLWIFHLERAEFEYRSVAFDVIWGQPRASVCLDLETFINTVHVDDRSAVRAAFWRVAQDELSLTSE
ncbi:MAG: GAF domain-containing protein [Rhodopila sp.]